MLGKSGGIVKSPVTKIIVVFLIIVAFLIAVFYVYGILPGNIEGHQRLASFGTYIGGVVTPLTVLAALIALVQRDKEHRSEIERITAQGHKIDLLRFIEHIESDIESTLSQITVNIITKTNSVQRLGADALFSPTMLEWKEVIPSVHDIKNGANSLNLMPGDYQKKILSFETFGIVAAYIKRLREHCEEYDRIAGNNITSLYFARKYKIATTRLKSRGYQIDVWDPTAQKGA